MNGSLRAQEEEVTGQNQATCPMICPISRFSALWMCSSSVVLCNVLSV